MFHASIDDAGDHSCGHKVVNACRGGNPKNPLVETSGEGCHKAEEGVLLDLFGMQDSWVGW